MRPSSNGKHRDCLLFEMGCEVISKLEVSDVFKVLYKFIQSTWQLSCEIVFLDLILCIDWIFVFNFIFPIFRYFHNLSNCLGIIYTGIYFAFVFKSLEFLLCYCTSISIIHRIKDIVIAYFYSQNSALST